MALVRKLWVIVCALCIAACSREDTVPSDSGRWAEPRLSSTRTWNSCTKSLTGERVVAQAQCGTPPPRVSCDGILATRERALLALPSCPDEAIAALKQFALGDAAAGSDLAAALYVRAQIRDRPLDLLEALGPVEHAVAASPRDAAVRFNHALILQELGLESEAIDAWDDFLKLDDKSEWAEEARDHRARLASPASKDLVTHSPLTAVKELETALINGKKPEVNAEALSKRLGNDRYPLDLLTLPEALDLEKQRRDAIRIALSGQAGALTILQKIESKARARHYRHLVARIRDTRGYVHFKEGKYLDAFRETEAALSGYLASGDQESQANVHAHRIGYYRTVGQHKLAWREAFKAKRFATSIGQAYSDHLFRGEVAMTAAALGYPNIARRYQSEAVRRMERADPYNLAVALRERAKIAIYLDRLDLAEQDLERAKALAPVQTEDANIRKAYGAREHEVRGRALLRNPPDAVREFSRALSKVNPNEQFTFRASLHAQLADAHRRAGQRKAAEDELRNALADLAKEEERVLATRSRGQGEAIWRTYFSRFDESYESLVRQLADQGDSQGAFAVAERAHAFETLDLILHHGSPPSAFSRLAQDGQPIALRDIQEILPPGTFLLQYDVQADRTYTWIISRDGFQLVRQRAKRADVERWTGALQDAAERGNDRMLTSQLSAPFDGLIAEPLAVIAKMPGGGNPSRLVFVPDGPMHGLPFAALRDARTRRHLVEFPPPIANAASATLYIYSLLRDAALKPARRPSILLIGDPAFDRTLPFTTGLHPLAGAQREVGDIQALYAPHAELLVGAKATAPALFAMASRHEILHFAGHAIANGEEPWQSLLLLALSEKHSGAIDANELLKDLKLHETRLAVLSACSSAGGLSVGPEGIAPLVRPFFASGVPAVIGSLWDVRDATAEPLLVSFHRHYRKGSDAATAMQAAQRELLRNKNAALKSALAWAPFQVIGHASSPFAAPQQQSWRNTLGIHSANLLQRPDGADSERGRNRTDRPAPQR